MTPSLGSVAIDLPRLLETRMLIQSNSGGGKSFCLRRVLEQTAPHVQQIVIDPEGEFATLREKHDYIVCAPRGADAVANPQTAAALALALWQARTSAILDIYELKAHERILFVRRFLEALVNAPRSVWNPALVVIDEAHIFAPQTTRAESLGAVIDLATRGRKRGLALIAATQRISKLHKDVAAETLNKLIGRTQLDVDVKRAMDELGMTNQREATQTLRNLDAGQFFAFGPALGREVELMKIGPVETTHPETGKRALVAPPPPSAKVRAQLAKIEGLQREAEDEVKTVAALSAELANTRRELTIAKKAQGGGVPEAEVQRRVREAVAALPPAGVPASMLRAVANAIAALQAIETNSGTTALPTTRSPRAVAPREPAPAFAQTRPGSVSEGLKAPEQRIVDAIAWWAAAGVPQPSRHQVAFVAGYTVNGHFNNQAGTLRSRALIDYPVGNALSLTDAGASLANKPDAKPTRDDLVRRVTAVLKGEPMRRVFAVLVEHNRAMGRADLAAACGYTENGHFNNIVGSLCGIGVAEYPNKGMVGLTPIFAMP